MLGGSCTGHGLWLSPSLIAPIVEVAIQSPSTRNQAHVGIPVLQQRAICRNALVGSRFWASTGSQSRSSRSLVGEHGPVMGSCYSVDEDEAQALVQPITEAVLPAFQSASALQSVCLRHSRQCYWQDEERRPFGWPSSRSFPWCSLPVVG